MKPILLAAVILACALDSPAAQVPPTGRWLGAIELPGTKLPVEVVFTSQSDHVTAAIDIPPQNAYGLTLGNVEFTVSRVYFELAAGPGLAVFDGVLADSRIEGTFRQGGAEGTFYLDPPHEEESAPPAPENDSVHNEEVRLEIDGATLHGTMTTPLEGDRFVTVLFISGSGPTDRNGNSAQLAPNNSLKMLAEALAENGIASLRYDKRGVGSSAAALTGGETDMRFDDFVDDAVAWCNQLRVDRRVKSLVIAGHSEGSLIGMLAASRGGAKGFVSIAGAGRPAGVLLREQLRGKVPASVFEGSEAILTELAAGRTSPDIPEGLDSLYRPSVQPYLISWMRHDPAQAIARLEIPTLVVQGTTDIQISETDARLLAEASGTLPLVVAGMNHVLKEVSNDPVAQAKSYGDPTLPLHPDLVDEMVEFLAELK